MFLQQDNTLARRRLVAETALSQMSAWISEGYELHGMNLPTAAHVSVAMGFAGAMRINGHLHALTTGPGAALSMVASVISGTFVKSTPHAEILLLNDTVAAAECLPEGTSLDDNTTDVRLFMWRLNKLARRLGSDEIAWEQRSLQGR